MKKKRNWGGVVYPESAPEDWRDILTLKGIPWACSPLHDKDLDPTGEPKKAHYHIILAFPGPTTENVVKELMEEIYQPMGIALESARGYYRYFTHKDNPDKYQYDENDIVVYNGFDVTDVMNNFEVFQHLKTIQNYIIENNIVEYSTLMDMLLFSGNAELWNVASSHTNFLNTYITSKRNKIKNGVLKKLDEAFNMPSEEVNIIDSYDNSTTQKSDLL